MAPVLWVVGEVMGAVTGRLVFGDGFGFYPLALGYGAAGAFVGWLLVEYHPAAREPRDASLFGRRR